MSKRPIKTRIWCFALIVLFMLGEFECLTALAGDLPKDEEGTLLLQPAVSREYFAPIKGKVKVVSVKTQQVVLAGQTLFALDKSRIEPKYDRARKEYVVELKLFSQANIGRSKRVESARDAELARAFQKFKAYEILLNLHDITAVNPGIIESLSLVPKLMLHPEKSCLIIKEINKLKITTPINAESLKQGSFIEALVETTIDQQPEKKTVETNNRKYYLIKGRVNSLSAEPGISPGWKSIQSPQLVAEIEFLNNQLILFPGMKVYLAGTKTFADIIEKYGANIEINTQQISNSLLAEQNNLQEINNINSANLESINKQFANLFSEQESFTSELALPYADSMQLIDQFRDLPDDMQQMLNELSATYPELGEISKISHTTIPDEFKDALESGAYDDLEFGLENIKDHLNLSEDETKVFEQFQEELIQTAFDENIDLEYTDTLEKVAGVDEYKQSLVELEHFQTKLDKEGLSKLGTEKLIALKDDMFNSVGMIAIFDQEIEQSLSLNSEKISQIKTNLLENDQAAFSQLETLVKTTLSDEQLKGKIVASLEKRNSIIQEEKRNKEQSGDISQTNHDSQYSSDAPRDERRRKYQVRDDEVKDAPSKEQGTDDTQQGLADTNNLLEYYKKYENRILPLSLLLVLSLSGILGYLKFREYVQIKLFKRKLQTYSIEVGNEKNFKTIHDAIISVQQLYTEKKKPKFDLVEIRVDADEYFEQIDCDWNYPCLLKIISSSEIPFRLVSKKDQPAIRITNAPGIMLSGLEIVGESTHAIELQGCTGSVVLQDLYLTGFSQTGIFISKEIFEGEMKLTIKMVEMIDAGSDARGVVINPRCYANFEASLIQIKFIGPMELGVEIISPIKVCIIQESVFANMQYGIVLTSVMEPFLLMQFVNNTFYNLDYGIVAERLDGLMVQAKQMHLFNNLFSHIKQAEFSIIKEANDQVMAVIYDSLYKFSEGNLTDGVPFFTRSAARVLIFQNPRLDKYLVQFISENSRDKNFLMLNPNDKVRSHLLSFRGSKPYLGGVAPRGHQDRLYDLALEAGQQTNKKK